MGVDRVLGCRNRVRASVAACLLLGGAALVPPTHAADPAPAAPASETGAPQGRTVQVGTLHWPPYTARELPRGGAVTAVVRAAFAQQGYRVDVQVWPWKRAIAKAKADSNGVAGYFPGYHCHHDPDADFVRSQPLGTSPLGFAEHRDAPHSWQSLSDLQDLRIGTVVGYANSEAFDRAVAENQLNVVTATDDLENLYRLLQHRIDLAVVDKVVLAYLEQADPTLRAHADELQFDARTLKTTELFICFRDDARGARLRELFNRGLDKLDAQGMLDRYVDRMVQG